MFVKFSFFVFINIVILVRDILFNIQPVELTKLGFRQYFNELASVGPIKDKIQPPSEAQVVFMACGKVASSTYDVGIVLQPSQLFNQQAYSYQIETEARVANNKDFFVYYNTGTYEPIGFTKEKEIFLFNIDCYECFHGILEPRFDGNWNLQQSQLDGHRVSAYTGLIILEITYHM